MKAILALLSGLTAFASAHANTLNYDFRGDWQSYTYNTAAGLPDSTRFYLKTGRLDFKGNLNDRFSYQLRWGFYKPAVDTGITNAKRDSLNSSVEYAYVTDKMSDLFALSLGKVNTEIGGLEGATAGPDLYLVSPNYQHTAVKTLSGANIGINQSGASNILYMTGAKGDFNFLDQHIYVMVLNNIADSADPAGNFNQNRGLMGLTWKGSFFDKALTGLASYHEVSPQSATGDTGNKHNFISAGVKYDTSSWVGSLEYTTTTYKDGASGNKDTLTSEIAKFGYKLDQWTPRLELFSSEEEIGIGTTTGTNKFMGYGVVVEYKPTAENFRYHLAYNTISAKPISGDTQTRTEIVLGARLLGDFLK
ncbi:MAG TPA: porin [Pseudobdellovibrionaceae bacterium]